MSVEAAVSPWPPVPASFPWDTLRNSQYTRSETQPATRPALPTQGWSLPAWSSDLGNVTSKTMGQDGVDITSCTIMCNDMTQKFKNQTQMIYLNKKPVGKDISQTATPQVWGGMALYWAFGMFTHYPLQGGAPTCLQEKSPLRHAGFLAALRTLTRTPPKCGVQGLYSGPCPSRTFSGLSILHPDELSIIVPVFSEEETKAQRG